MAAKDTNGNVSVWLQGNYVVTWPSGQGDLNTLVKRRVETTVTTGEMTARVLAMVKAARDAS